ncbi:hypothetical protein WA1_23550 [Scytonema hofmannii PCC 7110]|uniref:DUF928 domain-containing protein n=1 Tax=Scytonema hofmannii PCC 7110 TaxID=128403 RepID=A0A139X8Y5_9CYAN|nr:DUF928 domain-containing protein [Scytonema hofmannii]KYC41093.1 hypothetical protein WA1_23550 [Scytonema hofmannii PCC 7110]
MKLSVQKIQLSLAISLILLSCTQVQAQLRHPTRQLNRSLIFAAPPPPSDIGEPGKRSEAGSRGCGQDVNESVTSVSQKRLTALAPVYSKSELVFGTTIAERPSFWFYVPYSSSFAYGEFVLEDEAQNQNIYKVALTGAPGVISLRLPSKAVPLEIGKKYRWYFNIYCKKDNKIIADVEGYVKREQLNSALKTQLEKATPSQRVALYGTNGIWYEALSTAVQLRRTQPQETSWAALLQTVGLSDVATEPKVECCNLENQQ